ncbi:MAG: CapA family protein [Paenibacillaceae bacterium]|nr:CapA family protein [Paenibacillaceae bacterium]
MHIHPRGGAVTNLLRHRRTAFAGGLSLIVLLLLLLPGCRLLDDRASPLPEGAPSSSPVGTEAPIASPSGSPAASPTPSPSPSDAARKVTLAAVGDVLIHSSIYKDAQVAGGGYEFTPMFEPIRRYIESADLAMVNQESVIGGEALGLSDYPRFNSPYEVGDTLKAVGFDIVNLANNHTLDRGEEAITNEIHYLNGLGLVYTGAYLSEDDRQRIRVVEKNGLTFAFLSYTYGTNGIPVPKGKPYLVNLIDNDRAAADIAAARKLADVVIVSAHFGVEYMDEPSEAQEQFARAAAEAGADIVIGHHPHVLQPMEWIETASGRRTFVAYSLGNFIAAQDGARTQTGGILQLDIEKRGGTVTVSNPRFLPTWIHMTNWRQFRIVPLRDAGTDQLPNAAAFGKQVAALVGSRMPELTIVGD